MITPVVFLNVKRGGLEVLGCDSGVVFPVGVAAVVPIQWNHFMFHDIHDNVHCVN